MAATFAHITLVDELCREKLDFVKNLTPSMRVALQSQIHFCKLGAVSPDCPYLVGSTGATGYGNVMHYLHPANFVRHVVPSIYEMNFGSKDSRACMAWIFGYAAHLVTDLTIHPVVQKLVGDYEHHKAEHRICELHQDVYIYHQKTGQEITEAQFLKSSGLDECSFKGNTNILNPAVAKLWSNGLEKYHPAEIKQYVRLPKLALDPNNWYATYINLIDKFVTKGSRLPLASVFQGNGYAYPDRIDAHDKFIENLPTAAGGQISYDDLFDIAMQKVITAWGELAAALDTNQCEVFKLKNANLDTGLAEADNQPVFVV